MARGRRIFVSVHSVSGIVCVHVLSCELCLGQKWLIYVSLAATIGMSHLFVCSSDMIFVAFKTFMF